MSETVGGVLTTLQEMGFSERKAKKALNKTGWKGVEPAMEWLLAHNDDPSDEEEEEENEEASEVETQGDQPKKELTPEEKAEQLRKLEELRVKKRAEREAREAKEALEREKRMREEGKALSGLRKELEDQEIKRLAEERRREKRETQLAKERVKAQIEADRQARKEEEARRRGELVEAKPGLSSSPAPAAPTKSYDETRLQIRLTDGSAIVQNFKVKETLSAVRLFVELNRKDGVSTQPKLMTSFPKKVFTEEDYDKPLEALGLVPSAVLIVSK